MLLLLLLLFFKFHSPIDVTDNAASLLRYSVGIMEVKTREIQMFHFKLHTLELYKYACLPTFNRYLLRLPIWCLASRHCWLIWLWVDFYISCSPRRHSFLPSLAFSFIVLKFLFHTEKENENLRPSNSCSLGLGLVGLMENPTLIITLKAATFYLFFETTDLLIRLLKLFDLEENM